MGIFFLNMYFFSWDWNHWGSCSGVSKKSNSALWRFWRKFWRITLKDHFRCIFLNCLSVRIRCIAMCCILLHCLTPKSPDSPPMTSPGNPWVQQAWHRDRHLDKMTPYQDTSLSHRWWWWSRPWWWWWPRLDMWTQGEDGSISGHFLVPRFWPKISAETAFPPVKSVTLDKLDMEPKDGSIHIHFLGPAEPNVQ